MTVLEEIQISALRATTESRTKGTYTDVSNRFLRATIVSNNRLLYFALPTDRRIFIESFPF